MANLQKTYVGGQPVKAHDVIVGPIRGIVRDASMQIEVLSGSGAVGSYAYEVSNSGAHYVTRDTRSAAGIFPQDQGELFQRVQMLTAPAVGTTVRVTLSAITIDENAALV